MRSHRTPQRRLVVLLIIAVAALVPALVVPLVIFGEPDGDSPGSDPLAAGSTSPSTPALTTPATNTPEPATGAPVIPATGSAEAVDGGAKPEVAFTSISYEAEVGRLRGAEVIALEGGSGVRFTSQSGEIELEPVEVPARDRYRVTIVYAAEGDWRVAVRGSANAEAAMLASSSGCCTSVTVDVRISAGGSLTIEPSRGDGPLPTIDRILISPR